MVALSFPLEELFLGGYYLGTAHSIWTWIAVLTAAVSFWRITAIGSRLHPKSDGDPSFHDELRPNADLAETEAPQVPSPDLTPAENKAAELASFVRDDSVRKGVKFSAYYCEVDDADDDVRNDEEDDGRNEEDEVVGRACDGAHGDFEGVWEFDVGVRTVIQLPVVRRLRTRDMGWYRCQDLTAINGSVVRLWDGGRRKCHP